MNSSLSTEEAEVIPEQNHPYLKYTDELNSVL